MQRERDGIREEGAGGGEFKSEAGSLGCADTQDQAGEVGDPWAGISETGHQSLRWFRQLQGGDLRDTLGSE